jgi:hypothetical protein
VTTSVPKYVGPEVEMTQRTFSLITAVLFFLIALLHAARLFRGWQVTIEGAQSCQFGSAG